MESAAGVVLRDEVQRNADRYLAAVDVLVHADVARVRDILTDYPRLARVNPAIKEVVMLSAPHERPPRMRIVSRFCVLVFCKTLNHVQSVDEDEDGAIVATVDPAQSDFRYGRMEWHIVPAAGDTRIAFRAELIPGFWVPPLIGPLLIGHTLRREALETAEALEALALKQR